MKKAARRVRRRSVDACQKVPLVSCAGIGAKCASSPGHAIDAVPPTLIAIEDGNDA